MVMRLAAIILLCAAPLLAQGQDQQQDQPKQGQPDQKVRRLESITWNPVTNKLSWVVTRGSSAEDGDYKADETTPLTYEIDLNEVTMAFQGEKRRFAKEEAENVLVVMQLISRYAQESTVWWEQGKGDPVTKREKVGLRAARPGTPELIAELMSHAHPKP